MKERELIETIVKNLVDEPDSVELAIVEGEQSTIIELRVAEKDIGKVIGKEGRIAKAMRTLLNACSSKSGKRMVLEILD